jgi:HlyD family secretion protein
MSKKLIIILLVVVVVAALVVALGFKFSQEESPGIEVESEVVGRTEIVQTVTATGRIQPKTQVNISADVSAKITSLGVEEGDWVKQGALLVQLDSERHSASVESAEANERVAQANADVSLENMKKAEKDLVRARDLHRSGLETEAQLEAAEALYQVERARTNAATDQVAQAGANLKQLRDDLSKTRIYAPIAGTISVLNKEVGEIALGSQFQEDVILVLANLAGMEAEVKVDENDIVSVSIGDASKISVDALPDLELEGVVTEIASSASIEGSGGTDQKTEFVVKIAITDPDSKLRPGMTASVDIVTDVREDSLGIPIQAVAVRTPEQLGGGDGNGEGEGEGEESKWEADKDGFVELVFVIGDGTVSARQVETGIQSETHIEIVAGLEEGEAIVIGNYRAISRDLEDGSEVVVADDPATDDADAG